MDSVYSDCKPLMPFLLVTTLVGGKMIVAKDLNKVLVPKSERKKLVDFLHLTHMFADSMLRISKGSFCWPIMKLDLGNK